MTPNDEKKELQKNVLISLGVCAALYLFLSRSVLFYLPLFAGVLYFLWKKSGANTSQRTQEDDPADWWKNGKPSELDEF